jgi:hypothetical protein
MVGTIGMFRRVLAEMGRWCARATYRACYIGMPLYICGFVLLGAAFQNHLSVGAVVMGWGIAEVAIMVNTVAVCALSYARLFLSGLKCPSS